MRRDNIIKIAAISGALAVIFGALGAHALEELISAQALESFKTAVRYQMWHSLGLLLLASLADRLPQVRVISWLWSLGLLLFSGSIYLLSTRELSGWAVGFLGPITPVGGLLLIGGWLFLFAAAFRIPKKN